LASCLFFFIVRSLFDGVNRHEQHHVYSAATVDFVGLVCNIKA